MDKWSVEVRGEGFLIRWEDGVRETGFYTTRFVEAISREEAEQMAIELIRDDEWFHGVLENEPERSPMLYAESVRRISSFEGVEPPGSGYTFFRGAS